MILGDHTPGYMWRIPWACKPGGAERFGCYGRAFPLNTTAINIRNAIPFAKLVLLVRNPADRAFSHFHHFYDPNKCRPEFKVRPTRALLASPHNNADVAQPVHSRWPAIIAPLCSPRPTHRTA